jgi:hypothetical protein
MPNSNLLILEDAATKLQDLLKEVVFVGGATLGLLISDPGAAPVRVTLDVDVIVEILSYIEYVAFSERLRERNFNEDDSPGAPLCRWGQGDLILDVMPLDKSVLGFSNRWYGDAHKFAEDIELPSGITIRAINAPYFLATKFEAFRQRGQRDFYSSRDLEDIVSVIDGRESLRNEIAEAEPSVQEFLANEIQQLLKESQFLSALPGYLLPDESSQQRLPDLLTKLKLLSNRISL